LMMLRGDYRHVFYICVGATKGDIVSKLLDPIACSPYIVEERLAAKVHKSMP